MQQSCKYCVGVTPVWLMINPEPWEKLYFTQISLSTYSAWPCLCPQWETSQGL